MIDESQLSIVIPVYKQVDQFIANLNYYHTLLDGIEVIIVNDDPEQSIFDPLLPFKHVKLIENKKNLGFAGAVNTGIRATTRQYVMLLNSDVKLLSKSYRRAFEQFYKHPVTFAVGFGQRQHDGSIVGRNRIKWRTGMFQHYGSDCKTFGYTAWAEGGACMIDKSKLDFIGYFDEIYSPFYWEDIDLSYRAWKSGYYVYYDPEILVEHNHETTIKNEFKSADIERIAFRNQFLFMKSNITDASLKTDHFVSLLPNMAYYTLWKRKLSFFSGFLASLSVTSKVPRGFVHRSDLDILELFKEV